MNSGNHAKEHRPSLLRSFLGFVATLLVVIVSVYVLRTYVVEPFQVPSASMEPTIQGHEADAATGEDEVKDRILAEKVSFAFGSPEQGDIVTFTDPQISSRTLIKRVIATGGQTVDLVNDSTSADGTKHYVVSVDGQVLDEPYVARGADGTIASSSPLATATSVSISYPYTIPDGYVWVMGDNRENSADSRYFGAVPASTVFGKAFAVYWPMQDIGLID